MVKQISNLLRNWPPISIDGMIYLSTPESQMEWKVVAASKIKFSDEIRKQSIRWTK
jgi:hypothetical protein